MAEVLKSLLEPGERVLATRRGRSFAGMIANHLVMFALLTTFIFLSDALNQPYLPVQEQLVALALVTLTAFGLGGTVLLIAVFMQRRTPNEILVTDRRVLLAHRRRRAWLTRIAATEIAGITWKDGVGAHTLSLARAGKPIDLPAFDDPDTLATAIAESAGVEPPPRLGRFATMDLSFSTFFVFVTASYAALHMGAFGVGLIDSATSAASQESLASRLLVIPACGIGWLLTIWFGPLLTATIMRVLVTAEEMRAGLSLGAKSGWPLRLALRWAGVLYGGRLDDHMR